MPLRAALALLLLLPAGAAAQDLDQAMSALVRVAGERDGVLTRGSGFVVGLDADKATIVTASHVIEGVAHLWVTFATDLSERFPAGEVLGMEAGYPRGLAVFQLRGRIPSGVGALEFDTESRLSLGTALYLLGFPQLETGPRATQRALSARRGTLLLVDQDVGEGYSGGPVLQSGKVVGVITDTDAQTTYAVNAVVAREALTGWGVRLGGEALSLKRGAIPPNALETRLAEPAPAKPCVPGEESTVRGMVFIRVCPGTFMMGSVPSAGRAHADEKPAHEVTLSEFWIGETEVTNEQYRQLRPDRAGEAQLPATYVSWDEAKTACEHFGGRLPTEAEWEYVARAGSRATWSFGDNPMKILDYDWYGIPDSTPDSVGRKKPNAWGIHNLYGNVREWVNDWYGPYPGTAQLNPTGPPNGDSRVVRGGHFASSPDDMRSASRTKLKPRDWDLHTGFRCVRVPPG